MGHKNPDKKKNKSQATRYKGTLEVTRSGMGFVIVKELGKDVLVRPQDLNTAMHGDTVLVKTKGGGGSRIQGEIEAVVERKQTDFPGMIQLGEAFAFFVAES